MPNALNTAKQIQAANHSSIYNRSNIYISDRIRHDLLCHLCNIDDPIDFVYTRATLLWDLSRVWDSNVFMYMYSDSMYSVYSD